MAPISPSAISLRHDEFVAARQPLQRADHSLGRRLQYLGLPPAPEGDAGACEFPLDMAAHCLDFCFDLAAGSFIADLA